MGIRIRHPKTTGSSGTLRSQQFMYTLVFGQGPVQESEKVPTSGDEGLNLFSRLIALATATMLRKGITEKVILSGGETGQRAGTPEASTEAGLMADIIRRELKNSSGIDSDERILIEDTATDTFENFAHILNKYIDSADGSASPAIALLGIGFHAKGSRGYRGRLEVFADKLGLTGQVFSAEEVLHALSGNRQGEDGILWREGQRLLNLPEYHTVSVLKARQERFLVEYLEKGDWVTILPKLRNPDRGRKSVVEDQYVMMKLQEEFGYDKDMVMNIAYETLVQQVLQLDLEGRKRIGYKEVKQSVFDALAAMSKKEGVDYFSKYAKGEIPKESE